MALSRMGSSATYDHSLIFWFCRCPASHFPSLLSSLSIKVEFFPLTFGFSMAAKMSGGRVFGPFEKSDASPERAEVSPVTSLPDERNTPSLGRRSVREPRAQAPPKTTFAIGESRYYCFSIPFRLPAALLTAPLSHFHFPQLPLDNPALPSPQPHPISITPRVIFINCITQPTIYAHQPRVGLPCMLLDGLTAMAGCLSSPAPR